MRCAIGVTFQRDRRDRDEGKFRKPALVVVIFGFAFGKCQPPAVIMDGDRHVVGIVKRGSGTIEGFVGEFPGRGGRLPDQANEVAGIRGVTRTAAFRREVELIPPGKFRPGRKWLFVDFLTADQIAADRHEAGAALGPECRHDIGRASAPVIARHDGLSHAKGIEKGDHVNRECCLLPVACRFIRKKTCGAVSAQIGNKHAISCRSEDGRNVNIAVDVIRPSVQQQSDRALLGPGFGVTDIEYTRFDLLQGPKGRFFACWC